MRILLRNGKVLKGEGKVLGTTFGDDYERIINGLLIGDISGHLDLSHIKTLRDFSCSNCSQLTSVDLSNIEFIGNQSFTNCTSLQRVILPSTPPALGSYFGLNLPSTIRFEVPQGAKSVYLGTTWTMYENNIVEV